MPDLFSSLVSYGMNRLAQERSFQQQKELQNDAQNFNQMMFNLANQYNSPLAQMSRFKNAGLNPNLIYGQQANTASPISMGSGSAPLAASMSPFDTAESIKLIRGMVLKQQELDLKEKQANIDNINADTAEKNQNIIESGSRIDKNNAEIDQIAHQNNWTDQQIEESKKLMDKYDKEIEEIGVRIDSEKLEQDIQRLNKEFLEKSMDDRIELIKSEIKKNNAQANLSYQQAREISTLLTQKLKNLEAEWEEIQARTDLTKEQKDKLAQDKLIEQADNYYLEIAQRWHDKGGAADVLAFIPEMVHMFTHILHLSLK